MTVESHELALSLQNEDTEHFPYERRVDFGRNPDRPGASANWAGMVAQYARHYTRIYGGPVGSRIFSTEDILLAAAELSQYYREHAKEVDAA